MLPSSCHLLRKKPHLEEVLLYVCSTSPGPVLNVIMTTLSIKVIKITII